MAKEEGAENLTQEAQEAERSIISPVETILMVTISAMGDLADLVGLFALPIPVIGMVIYFFAKSFSYFVWLILMLWAFLRTSGAQATAKKVITLTLGKGIDELSTGILPIQTIMLIITILLHNRAEQSGLLEKGLGALKRIK